MVSYADFITLLFATFTALYALSVADMAKLKEVATNIRDGFNQQSLMKGIESLIEGKSPPAHNPDPLSQEKGEGGGVLGKHDKLVNQPAEFKAENEAVKSLKKAVENINEDLQKPMSDKEGLGKGKGGEKSGKKKNKARAVELAVQDRGIRISFDSSLLFDSGSAALKESSKATIDKVAAKLQQFSHTNFIHVEGHTDSDAISSAVYPSNWELSTARSSAVIRYLLGQHKFDAGHMASVGYGDSRPIAPNDTPEGKQKNRRIDVIVYNLDAGKSVDVQQQYRNQKVLIKAQDDENKTVLKTYGPAEGDKAGAKGTKVFSEDAAERDHGKGPTETEVIPILGKPRIDVAPKLGKFDPLKPTEKEPGRKTRPKSLVKEMDSDG